MEQQNKDKENPLVGVVMGSKSDLEPLDAAAAILKTLGIPYEFRILSAHRTPEETLEYAAGAEARGIQVLIAAAGAAAALPGVLAAKTLLPVLGVPLAATPLQGMDALLSIVQMPKGVPVGTLAIGSSGAGNAALLAAEILALSRPEIKARLRAWRDERRQAVLSESHVDR